MQQLSTNGMRRLIIAAFAAAGLCTAIAARADAGGPLYFPLTLARATPWPGAEPAPTPYPVPLSAVLDAVPEYPGARLEFFEAVAESEPQRAYALYSTGNEDQPRVLEWYRSALEARGWKATSIEPTSQRWRHYHGWLTVAYKRTSDGATRLELARNIEAASLPHGRALVPDVPVPEGAIRLRLDAADLLTEELRLTSSLDEARMAIATDLAGEGWSLTSEAEVAGSLFASFGREGRVLLVSFSVPKAGTVEVGLGEFQCWIPAALADPGARAWSVYLDAVPAPPASEIQSYQLAAGDGLAVERWSHACQDLDLLQSAYSRALESAGWSPASDDPDRPAVNREPGRLSLRFAPADGRPPISAVARTAGGGALSVSIERPSDGRRRTADVSLLFDDVPVPSSAEAESMLRNVATGWDFEEEYSVAGATSEELAGWCNPALTAAGWNFERLEPPDVGPHRLFFSGGEEVLYGFGAPSDDTVTISRRRVCESGTPVEVPDEGEASRFLQEVPVYPGAEFAGYDAPRETYGVECSDLAMLVNWYRAAMERGDWRLAAIEGPEDPHERRLIFVRPQELELPPEERTAWAEIQLVRAWPYQYVIHLSRDPSGVRPGTPP
jgi:hypothetical protein